MRRRLLAAALAAVMVGAASFFFTDVKASPQEEYVRSYFGRNNFPPGCTRSMTTNDPMNICYRMRTDMNGLDSPQVDVLVLVPASPFAERDLRVMRQSVQMWEAGIDSLAPQMGMEWLAEGVDFHITVDSFDPAGKNGGEFTTYPIVDPEIVVVASNPVGGIGIGIDPLDFVLEEEGLCHGVPNALAFEQWKMLPGFNDHHGGRTGTYVEDCKGSGGNICFAVNGAIDPAPEHVDFFRLFDLVSHEFGHCMSLGHVGDGAEGSWGALPTNDIMAYHQDPPDRTKCMSSLDVEGVALRMSRYLDVNGDGRIDERDYLEANDQIGESGYPFQVQHPVDHVYASSTGLPKDCPQPDLGPTPGAVTDWTPAPVPTKARRLTLTSPPDGTALTDPSWLIDGVVERKSLIEKPVPVSPQGFFDDPDDDASTPMTEITQVDVGVTPDNVNVMISVEQLWPSTDVTSPVAYSATINGRRFDSFVRYPIDANPRTWDGGAKGYMDAGASVWDLENNTVTFHIPRALLAGGQITAPYFVSTTADLGGIAAINGLGTKDDAAPDAGDTIGVAGAKVAPVLSSGEPRTVRFERDGGNVFLPTDSTAGERDAVDDTNHYFTLAVPETSDVQVTLAWDTPSDLDLSSREARKAADGQALTNSEVLELPVLRGPLEIVVSPFAVTVPTEYTLVATITPSADGDGDGVADGDDRCPELASDGPNGCPFVPEEFVRVYLDGNEVASEAVDTGYGPDAFSLPLNLSVGTHQVKVVWEDTRSGIKVESETLNVTRLPDADGDLVADSEDNCPKVHNHEQADMDGDGRGDVCDSDMDGDGFSNAEERRRKTDPADPDSHPKVKRRR